jgi:hypothetical protein
MPSYLVETYLPRGASGERTARERRAHSAAEELTRQGTPVRFDRTLHVPEDEICFFIFDARARDRAGGATGRARPLPSRRGRLVRKGLSKCRRHSSIAFLVVGASDEASRDTNYKERWSSTARALYSYSSR